MIEYSPRSHFEKFQKEAAEELGKHIDQKWFRLALDAALANTASQGLSSEEMQGVNRFIRNLMALCEPTDIPEPFPSPRLPSYDQDQEIIQEHFKKVKP